jgi:hypothetical protein
MIPTSETNYLKQPHNKGRLYEMYLRREAHKAVVIFLMFVTNCRYIGTNQPYAICAVLPLIFQCLGILVFLVGTRCNQHQIPLLPQSVSDDSPSRTTTERTVLRVCHLSIYGGAAVSIILSMVYIHHLLQCTVSIVNAYTLVVIGVDLWMYKNEEFSTSV